MDHPIEAVEGRQPRRERVLEISEDIVLDNGQAERFGQLQYPVRRDRRKRGPGRIVDSGVGDVEPGPVLMERLSEQLRIRPRRGIGNADDASAMGAQQRMEIEIAGVVHQYGVSRLEQESA